MAKFVLSDPLDFKTITNLYLYGSPTTPPGVFDRIQPTKSSPDIVEIDAYAVMKGPGRVRRRGIEG